MIRKFLIETDKNKWYSQHFDGGSEEDIKRILTIMKNNFGEKTKFYEEIKDKKIPYNLDE